MSAFYPRQDLNGKSILSHDNLAINTGTVGMGALDAMDSVDPKDYISPDEDFNINEWKDEFLWYHSTNRRDGSLSHYTLIISVNGQQKLALNYGRDRPGEKKSYLTLNSFPISQLRSINSPRNSSETSTTR